MILTPPQFQLALQATRQRSNAEELLVPGITTESGRQLQIQPHHDLSYYTGFLPPGLDPIPGLHSVPGVHQSNHSVYRASVPVTISNIANGISNSGVRQSLTNSPLLIFIEENGNLSYGPEATPITMEFLKAKLHAAVADNPKTQISKLQSHRALGARPNRHAANSKAKLAINSAPKAPVGQILLVTDAAKDDNVKEVNGML